jgi:hypothetical protein
MQVYRCSVHQFSVLVETKLPNIGDDPGDSVRRINSGKGEISKLGTKLRIILSVVLRGCETWSLIERIQITSA